MPSDDGTRVEIKEFSGTKAELDRIEEEQRQAVAKMLFANVTGLGETPAR